MNRTLGSVAVLALGASLAGCGSGTTPPKAAPAQAGETIIVFAMPSLQASLTQETAAFETTHHAIKVQLSFGAATNLVQEIKHGAPVDVLAAAAPQVREVAIAAPVTQVGAGKRDGKKKVGPRPAAAYEIAVLRSSQHQAAARTFAAYIAVHKN